MQQGTSKKLKPKDKHTKASWKKRDEGRKGKQEAFAAMESAATVEEAVLAADAVEDV